MKIVNAHCEYTWELSLHRLALSPFDFINSLIATKTTSLLVMALAGAASLADGFPDDRLTRFPDLRSNVVGSQDVRNARTLELELTKADESTAIFFWGVFLSRYTGNDEVAFMFDDDIVTVQINNWTFERNRVEGDISPLRGGTGIFIQVQLDLKEILRWRTDMCVGQ